MYIYAIIFSLLIYAIYQEIIDLSDSRYIDKNSIPNSNDSCYKLLQKYKKSISYFYMNSTRSWRIPYMSTIFILFLIWYIIFKRIPTEWELLICGSPVLLFLYTVLTYYQHHLTKNFTNHLVNISNHLENKLEKCLGS